MAVFDWFGGVGRFAAARLWNPRGVPGTGDTAVVGSGDVVIQGRQVGATVDLGGTGSGAPPAVELRHATLAGLTMPSDLPTGSSPTGGSLFGNGGLPPEYGVVNVRGHSGIGSLEVGNFASYAPVSSPEYPHGHGELTVPDNLLVNLLPGVRLDTGFDVKDGSTLTVSGGAGSSLHAGNSSTEGGTVVIDAPLLGQGTVTVSGGAIPNEDHFPHDTGSLELGGRVGAGETIDLNIGRVVIDKPLEFAGTLNVRASEAGGIGVQDVTLRGLAASSYAFDDAAHRLTLYDGGAALDTIQFSASTTSGTFEPKAPGTAGYGHLAVVQTSEGVQLQGPFESRPTGSTDIPLRTAAG
jgi:hypothetical protein